MFKNYDFCCPFCNAVLNKKESVVLKTKRKNGEEGLIYLSATVGDYEYRHEPDIQFDEGEVLDFLCTACDASLNSKEFSNYGRVKMIVKEEEIEFDVIFSRKSGVHKTYLITEDGIETYSGT
ncbi:MAG: hypothetical protein WDZ35_08205 [Crocinitomicaceae bacterium]